MKKETRSVAGAGAMPIRRGLLSWPTPGTAAYAGVLLCGIVFAFVSGRRTAERPEGVVRSARADGAVRTKEGPWGEIERTPITIAAPDESLPVKAFEGDGITHWFFKDMSQASLASLMENTGVPDTVRKEL